MSNPLTQFADLGQSIWWDARAMPMERNERGLFTLTLQLATGREYQFRYLVNGAEWYNDWNADRYTSNPFGGDNSVVIV